MLSWSSNEAGASVDLTSIATGEGVPVDAADELWSFASACGGGDDVVLGRTRDALATVTDEAFMVDAAAVAANFEMMTRLADSTGARLPAEVLESRAAVIGALGIADLTSRR